MQIGRLVAALLFLPILLVSQCSEKQPIDGDRLTPQGWTRAQQIAWYTTSQGSRLVPQAWLHALEQPDNSTSFLDPAFIASFRYLPSPSTGWTSPDPSCPLDTKLPLGFAVDCQSDAELGVTRLRWKTGQSDREPWVGMNCSACHTTELTYNGTAIRIDGGPTLADFQSFTEALERSLQNTLQDQAKFARFATNVLGSDPASADVTELRKSLADLVDWNAKLARLNAAPIRYGFGRLDAIGHIFNKVALEAMPQMAAGQIANPADAPVSYPFLWNVTQLDRVEWNGIAQNMSYGTGPGRDFNLGGLTRNTGEVIGVFADLTVTRKPGLDGYRSSIVEPALVGMEEQLEVLHPPKWPAAFPKIDMPLAKTGADLFVRRHCDTCHTVPTESFDVGDKYTVTLTRVSSPDPNDHPVNTDMWMACNAVFDGAKSGAFEGSKVQILSGNVIGKTSDDLGLVQNAVAGSLLGKKPDLFATKFQGVFGLNRGLPLPTIAGLATVNPKDLRRNQCLYAQTHKDNIKSADIVYKGRPLQGIWATAPYLHNGSITSLYELLLPPSQRRAVFYTGSREFDPKEVGLKPDPSPDNSFKFEARDAGSSAAIDGNSNEGHDYDNAALTDADRWALVEYMKTL